MIKPKNKIKLIAVDLDGTLLKDDKTISKHSIETLAKCRQKGILIAIASARPVRAVDLYLDEIRPSAKICHNGGITFVGEMVINQHQITAENAHNIVCRVNEKYPEIKIACEYKETLYTNFDASEIWGDNIDYVQSDFSHSFADSVDKVIVNIEDYPDLAEYIYDILPPNVYVDIADNHIAYIMNKHAAKHCALSPLLEHLNIGVENVVCFGDDTPDIGMIKLCGVGVAMENAKDSVKEAADYICASNENDGIAKWLEENVL